MLKISNNGIEISSDRYLTDNATGLFFLLNWLIIIKMNMFPLLTNLFSVADLSINILLWLILFVLSTAVGLIISSFSFATLELVYISLEHIWWKLKWPLYPVQFKQEFEKMKNEYNLVYKYWHCRLAIFEEELIRNGINIDRFLIQRGIRILLRNVSFILLIDIVMVFLFENNYNAIWKICIVILISLLMSSYIGFFANVGLLLKYKMNMQK